MYKLVDKDLLIEIRRRLLSEVGNSIDALYEWKLFNVSFGSHTLIKRGYAPNSDKAYDDAMLEKKSILISEGTYVENNKDNNEVEN